MTALTMPQIAQRLSVKEEHIGFAARLGRLPAPVGRSADGLLLFAIADLKPLEQLSAGKGQSDGQR